MSIADNIRMIRRQMEAAADRAGRNPDEILLIGASKMNDAAACREAIAAGIDALGENRVQEMQQKLSENAYEGAPLHFIGHLQRNKVRQVVGQVDLIHSVSSPELLAEIQRQAEKFGIVQDILLEVNIGGEESKSGFSPDMLRDAAASALQMPNVRLRGLMTIPPIQQTPHGNLPYFEEVRRLYVDINNNLYHNNIGSDYTHLQCRSLDCNVCNDSISRI